MKKVLLASVFAVLAMPALANPTMVCAPPDLFVPESDGPIQFRVACESAPAARGTVILAPKIEFSGTFDDKTATPYRLAASYRLSAQPEHDYKLGLEPRPEQLQIGTLASSLTSAASLSAQLAAQLHWDASSGVLSVEEQAGLWRAVKVDRLSDTVTHAGYASLPVVDGAATAHVPLGAKLSRFAGKTPVQADAVLQLIDGKLEVMMGSTQKANEGALKEALKQLDASPKDLTRAWALGALAKYLNRPEEVRYAERKVAAAAPQHLEAFQDGLARISPYSLDTVQPK